MKSPRKLPDPTICKTKHIAGVHYFCTVEERRETECAHAMSFGYSYVCLHPDAGCYDSDASDGKQDENGNK